MKQTVLYILLSVLVALLAACDKESDSAPIGTGNALCVRAVKLGFLEEHTQTRTVTSGGMNTTFQTGDAIGIFAVTGGVVASKCKNLKLTLQADGSWGGDPVEFIEGATYFAYSPYRDVAGINSATSIADIVANFEVSNNQSTAALFAANDLLTSTTCRADKEAQSLTITFEHALSILEMDYMYCKSPTTNTGPAWIYRLETSVAYEIKLMDLAAPNVVSSYTNTNSKRHFLLKPGNRLVASIFKREDGSPDPYVAVYDANVRINLAQGTYYQFKPYQIRELQPGDYYYYSYRDNSIYPREWKNKGGTPPVTSRYKCVGVVFWGKPVTTEGALRYDKIDRYGSGSEGHGYVAALRDVSHLKYRFGQQPHSIGADYSNTKDYQGYWNTIVLRTWGNDVFTEANLPAAWQAYNYNSTGAITPGDASYWYFPSCKQVQDMSICDFESVGGDNMAEPQNYWSSSFPDDAKYAFLGSGKGMVVNSENMVRSCLTIITK